MTFSRIRMGKMDSDPLPWRMQPDVATQSRAGLASVISLAIILVGFGCESDPSGQAQPASLRGVTIRDSAGVEIVENQAPERSHGSFWSLSPEPEFVLGGAEHGLAWEEEWEERTRDELAAMIFGVRGVARLADGRIAVLSEGNHQILLFEPSGRLSRAIGGRGPGPGEFIRPEHMQYLPPDTLAVWDHWMGPVSYFDTTGTLLAEKSIDLGRTLASLPDATAESRTTPLPDGSFVVAVQRRDPDFTRPAEGTVFRYPPVQFSRIDLATYIPVPLGTWDGPEVWAVPKRIREGHPQLADMGNPGMVLDSHIAVGGDPPMVYVSNGDRNEILQFALDGTLVRSIRRGTDPLAVTTRADRARKQYLAALAESLGQGSVAAFTRALPRRDTYPAVAALVVDTEGHLWVREWSASETGMPDQWSVFSAEGRWLGVLEGVAEPWLCVDMAPCWIDRDMFVITRHDDVGRERLEGYRIHREG